MKYKSVLILCSLFLIACDQVAESSASQVTGDSKNFLIVDLEGNGFDLLPLSKSNVYFDVDGDGWAEKTQWVEPDDGLLFVQTLTERRQFSKGGELDGMYNGVVTFLINGLDKIKNHDTNEDGIYDISDFFKYGKQKPFQTLSISIVQDKDGDGIYEGKRHQRVPCKFKFFNFSSEVKDGNLICEDGASYNVRNIQFEYEDTNKRWDALCNKIENSHLGDKDPYYIKKCQ